MGKDLDWSCSSCRSSGGSSTPFQISPKQHTTCILSRDLSRMIVTVTPFQICETCVVFRIIPENGEAAPASSERFPTPVRHFFFTGLGSWSRPAAASGVQRWQLLFKFITNASGCVLDWSCRSTASLLWRIFNSVPDIYFLGPRPRSRWSAAVSVPEDCSSILTPLQICETYIVGVQDHQRECRSYPCLSERFPTPVRHFFFTGPGSWSIPTAASGLQGWQLLFKFITNASGCVLDWSCWSAASLLWRIFNSVPDIYFLGPRPSSRRSSPVSDPEDCSSILTPLQICETHIVLVGI